MIEGDLDVRIVRRDGPQERLLFLVHGYGEPTSVLTDHLDVIDPKGRFLVATPVGPFEKKGKPIWHRALFGSSDDATVQYLASLGALQRSLVQTCENSGLDPAEVMVGGFSQGAGLAIGLCLAIGPVATPPPLACVAFCGFAPPIAGLEVDLDRVIGLPLFLSVADDDAFVPMDGSRRSAATLASFGFGVRYYELHSRHEITPEAARLAGAWLDELGGDDVKANGGARPGPGTVVGSTPVPDDPGGLRDFVLSLWDT